MRFLTDRLAWLDTQTRQLAAENEYLRRELDDTTRRIEVEARERAQEILAEAGSPDLEVEREEVSQSVSRLEGTARTRIEEIRARGAALEVPASSAIDPGAWPAPEGEPHADLPPPAPLAVDEPPPAPDEDAIRAQRERADALQEEVDALLRLREGIVESIRELLLGQAERLAEAEREHARAGEPGP